MKDTVLGRMPPILVLALCGAVACAHVRATPLGERTSWDDPPLDLRAAIRFGTDYGIPPERITIWVSNGRQTQTIHGASFRPTPTELHPPYSPWYETPSTGALSLAVLVRGEGGDTIGLGRVPHLPLQPQWAWRVKVTIRRTWGGRLPCIRCPIVRAFPLNPVAGHPPTDSLYIEMTGYPIAEHLPPS